MDGWESRRKRIPGNDWCIIQLGFPGRIRGVMVDTAHFTGNQVPRFSLRAATVDPADPRLSALAALRKPNFSGGQCAEEADMAAATALKSEEWKLIIPKTRLLPGYQETRQHFFEIDDSKMGNRGQGWTHIRLDQFPDGGIARLRVYGEVVQPNILAVGEAIDLAAASNGGVPVACSNKHYGTPSNLIAPGRAANMGEGWETARNPQRPAVHTLGPDGKLALPPEQTDWAILRLATPGMVHHLEVDTNHFKGNCPESCLIEGIMLDHDSVRGSEANPMMANRDVLKRMQSPEMELDWKPILCRTGLTPHTRHYFKQEDIEASAGPFSHVKITIFPDGGVSRLRIFGAPVVPKSSL